jgi:predicted ATP-binding protein involved in virulence
MLKIFIGPNGYGKTYELERIKKSLFDEDKSSDETNNKINTELQKNKYYMFSEILEKEIGYNGDKGNLPKFLDYLTNYNDYEKSFPIVKD